MTADGEVSVEPKAKAAALVSGGTGGAEQALSERLGVRRRKLFAGRTRREASWCIPTRSQAAKMEISAQRRPHLWSSTQIEPASVL
jgi:hypothetical protein